MHDTKRGRIFKWLDGIAQHKAAYSKGFTSIPEILTIYGGLYATNGILLAQVHYPEFEHLSDEGWKAIDTYTDEHGFYLETPKLRDASREYRERIFSDQFIKEIEVCKEFSFNPAVMKDALYPFTLYKINPLMVVSGGKCELSGHDDDVSIRVLFMGLKW